jgi:hypothetical protein
MKAVLGGAVLNPGWLTRFELVERTIDLEGFLGMLLQANPDVEAARQLYAAILDPTLEALAQTAVAELYPHLPANRVKRIVKDLRENGSAEFLDKVRVAHRPTVRALIPGYNYFVMGSASSINKARGHLVIERVHQAELESLAADNEWNKGFVAKAIGTAGLYSALGEGMQRKQTTEDISSEDKTIELWTTSVLQFDPETNAAGIYCTTFSPHVKPGQGDGSRGRSPHQRDVAETFYAHHYLLDFAHRNPPFILARREVTGPGMFDSRGVPEVTMSNSNVIRNLQKAGVARAHLEVNPPRAFIGFGGTKVGDWNTPGAKIESLMPNADIKDLGPSKGNPQVGEMSIERVERGTHRLFAFPDAEVHPARWQPRAMRKSRRALNAWRQCYTQLVVLCYQNFDEYELAAIIGKWPQLKLEDVLQHRITLSFDPRGLDNDWRKQTLETIMQLLQMDKGGLVDTGAAIRIIGSYTDPMLMEAIIRDPAGAQAALYRQVEGDMMSLMDGNPPQMAENDATAEMQLKMAMQIVGQNQKYQQTLMQDAGVQENFKAWVQNRQHNVQETQLSPQQGRLGTAQMPSGPVRQGAPQAGV